MVTSRKALGMMELYHKGDKTVFGSHSLHEEGFGGACSFSLFFSSCRGKSLMRSRASERAYFHHGFAWI